jgi:hypothetical protein
MARHPHGYRRLGGYGEECVNAGACRFKSWFRVTGLSQASRFLTTSFYPALQRTVHIGRTSIETIGSTASMAINQKGSVHGYQYHSDRCRSAELALASADR